jgi:formate hydrogenlyase subunit 6/NADH:ubiquinone oxidoreductase subunit I
VSAIAVVGSAAKIDDESCIRCGRCHDICPQDAVRHDGERIPQEVEANLAWARELLEHYDTDEDRRGFVERMKRYFVKEKRVAERTIEQLGQWPG